MVALVWFRRDLRVHDHPALSAALASHAQIVPVFCLDDRLPHGRHASGRCGGPPPQPRCPGGPGAAEVLDEKFRQKVLALPGVRTPTCDGVTRRRRKEGTRHALTDESIRGRGQRAGSGDSQRAAGAAHAPPAADVTGRGHDTGDHGCLGDRAAAGRPATGARRGGAPLPAAGRPVAGLPRIGGQHRRHPGSHCRAPPVPSRPAGYRPAGRDRPGAHRRGRCWPVLSHPGPHQARRYRARRYWARRYWAGLHGTGWCWLERRAGG
jgi:hypothetical protein